MELLFGKAVITSKGVYFAATYYSCKSAIKFQWFNNTKVLDRQVVVAYYKEDLSRIWLIDRQGIYTLNKLFHYDMSLEETELYFKKINRMKQVRNELRRYKRLRKKRYRLE